MVNDLLHHLASTNDHKAPRLTGASAACQCTYHKDNRAKDICTSTSQSYRSGQTSQYIYLSLDETDLSSIQPLASQLEAHSPSHTSTLLSELCDTMWSFHGLNPAYCSLSPPSKDCKSELIANSQSARSDQQLWPRQLITYNDTALMSLEAGHKSGPSITYCCQCQMTLTVTRSLTQSQKSLQWCPVQWPAQCKPDGRVTSGPPEQYKSHWKLNTLKRL